MTTSPAIQIDRSTTFDVVIVGAGISGINTAHHLKQRFPNIHYTVLESRSRIGGTWDLFRYPGIRSDSDLQSFGFAWNPWMENRAITDGESIIRYLSQTIQKDNIDNKIQFEHHVVAANWDSRSHQWHLRVKVRGLEEITYKSRFIVLGTGYYDYAEPLQAHIPGLREVFTGQVVHPQFWPEGLDHSKKRIVIVGSGATAVTLLPSLAKDSRSVTMVQRSPTYIMSVNNTAGTSFIHKFIPSTWSFHMTRATFIATAALTYYLCRAFPTRARSFLLRKVAVQLPKHISLDPHFEPLYSPWDQRLCFTPDGDFFECLRNGTGSIETSQIRSVTENSVRLESGKELEADIIVTATGIQLGLGGNIKFSIDNVELDLADRFAWRSVLLEGVPNLAFMIGYINASWSLGAEVSAEVLCRILQHMDSHNFTTVTPQLQSPICINPQPFWNLYSTYAKQGRSKMPKCGDAGPWKGRTNYWWDLWRARWGSITRDLQYR